MNAVLTRPDTYLTQTEPIPGVSQKVGEVQQKIFTLSCLTRLVLLAE